MSDCLSDSSSSVPVSTRAASYSHPSPLHSPAAFSESPSILPRIVPEAWGESRRLDRKLGADWRCRGL
jgi:hypothetical protein